MNARGRGESAGLIVAGGVTKRYLLGGQLINALDHVSFRIERGEMIAIRGPSGSGKSTLMNILGCLDCPDDGFYRFAGVDVATLGDDELSAMRNRRIGFVFQSFNLLARMSALENVELPILYAGGADARERAEEAMRVVGLADRMHHQPSQLSGGQRQRTAIARAIVSDPDIVLADEPTGSLDSATGREILDLFAQLNEQQRTVLIVTHDAAIARECPREIYLQDGRIVAGAEPSERLS